VTPALIPLRIPSLALLFLVLASPAACEDFLDDAAIKDRFETHLTRLFQQGGIPTGSTTATQLRSALRAPAHAFPATTRVVPADPVSPVDSDLSSAFTLAKEATLVLGHLYLCGKCDRHHGNLAGGVLISSDGLALTNYHVLDFREAVVFGAMTAAGEVYAIDEVLAASKSDDVALIRLRGAKDLAHLPLGTGLKTGEALFVVSHPDGHFYTLTHGYLARRYLTPKERVPRLQITADFAKGSSGCGILNRRGELVGLVASTSSIYYNEAEGKRENLQMVVKAGVPAESIAKLLQTPPSDANEATAP